MITDISEIKKRLTENEGIIGRDKYMHAAVLIPLIEINKESCLLFQRRAEHIPQANEICFPGGRFEEKKDHSFRDTALRETVEELGICEEKIDLFGKLGTVIASMGVLIEVYVGYLAIKSLDELKIDKAEVAEVFPISIARLRKIRIDKFHIKIKHDPYDDDKLILPAKQLKLPQRYHQIWSGRKQRVFAFKTDYGTIWGITAEIVNYFLNNIS